MTGARVPMSLAATPQPRCRFDAPIARQAAVHDGTPMVA
jgi:hypothetical protein